MVLVRRVSFSDLRLLVVYWEEKVFSRDCLVEQMEGGNCKTTVKIIGEIVLH